MLKARVSRRVHGFRVPGKGPWGGGREIVASARSLSWRPWRISRPGKLISQRRRVAIIALPPRMP
jgi:hypothetical protein